MSTLICVGPDDVDRTWPLVREMIDSAYAKTDDRTPDILAWLKRGDGLLWIAADSNRILAALTTSIVQRRSGSAFRLWAVGGTDINVWKGHLDKIEEYARSLGCVKVVFDGRQGWARMLSGYRPTTIAFEKGL